MPPQPIKQALLPKNMTNMLDQDFLYDLSVALIADSPLPRDHQTVQDALSDTRRELRLAETSLADMKRELNLAKCALADKTSSTLSAKTKTCRSGPDSDSDDLGWPKKKKRKIIPSKCPVGKKRATTTSRPVEPMNLSNPDFEILHPGDEAAGTT
jgi:hypothetical protein